MRLSGNRYRGGKAMRTKKEIKYEILRRKKNSEEYFIGFVQALLWVLNEKPKTKEEKKMNQYLLMLISIIFLIFCMICYLGTKVR